MKQIKILILFVYILIPEIINSQMEKNICKFIEVVPVETFYLCSHYPWVLVFEENFNEKDINLNRWNYGPHIRYCNTEQQYYTYGDNIEISNGILKIIARKETIFAKAVDYLPDDAILYCNEINKGTNKRYFYYTSANIETNKKFWYGIYEARIKIPKGKGFWPAFWLFGGEPIYNEIDIFEFLNEETDKIIMTTHFDFNNDGQISEEESCKDYKETKDFSDDFHIYKLIWEKDKIEWYIDDQLMRREYSYYTILGQAPICDINAWHSYLMNTNYPKDPMHIIINFAILSENSPPDNSTVFPAQMEVDWIKYYKREPCHNVYINDISQYPLDTQLCNFIVGKNINIKDNYYILPEQEVNIIAKDRIILGGGVQINAGSLFIAKIDPSICGSSLKNLLLDSLYENECNVKDNETNILENFFLNEGIVISPHPGENSFIIDFKFKDYKNYVIVITNIEGKIILTFNQLNSPVVDVDLNWCTRGVYVLYIIDKVNKSTITHKIIVQ